MLSGDSVLQAYWYRQQWLLRIDDARADKPFSTGTADTHLVHIVESWEKPRPVPPPSNWPVSPSCNLAAFKAECFPTANTSVTSCLACTHAHGDSMEKWHCDGPNVWQTLCSTGGVKPPPAPPTPTSQRNITVFSDAASVELFVNGVSQGEKLLPTQSRSPNASTVQTWAEWDNIEWLPGNITVIARDLLGSPVAVDTRWTCGVAAALVLSIDAPSPLSGTGSKLLLDGQDAALVRGSVVDNAGHVVHDAAHAITFSIVSGPGRINGLHNGNVANHARNDATTLPAYHGLVRAVVSVTSVAGLPRAVRELLASIDIAADLDGLDGEAADSIVVEATAAGIPGSARIEIPLSRDPATDGVLAVAAAAAGRAVHF